jgi:hypothetical protein
MNNIFDYRQLRLNAAETIPEDFHIMLMTVWEISISVAFHQMAMENLTVQ